MVEKLLIRDWDTQFFGFRVASVHGQNITREELVAIQHEMVAKEINLTYLYEANPTQSQIALKKHLPLLDSKTWFTKDLIASDITELTLSSILGQSVTPELLTMAHQSGEYSRFKIDPQILPEQFERLYKLWLEQSLTGDKAWEVLITKQNGLTTGFVTLEESETGAQLGLLAVGKEFRRQGFGKQLMQGALNASWHHGCRHIEVITQAQNTAACALYTSFGFQPGKIENIYHLWSNSLII